MEELDAIMGTFSKDIKMAATDKDFKGTCFHCNEVIRLKTEAIKAMGHIYHVEHFICEGCQKVIQADETFFQNPKLVKPFHKQCYETKFCEQCVQCQRRIVEGKILHASGSDEVKKSFHVACFRCGTNLGNVLRQATQVDQADQAVEKPVAKPGCGRLLHEGDAESQDQPARYLIQDDCVYCTSCFENHFVPSCKKCGLKILGDRAPPAEIDAAHDRNIRYLLLEGEPCCVPCYESTLPMCARCGKVIRKGADGDEQGLYLTVNETKYHPKCFACFDCGKPFEDLKAFVLNGTDYYCREHYDARSSVAAR